jgi:hypothetical protein
MEHYQKNELTNRYEYIRNSWLFCYGNVCTILCLFQTKVSEDGEFGCVFSVGMVRSSNPKQPYDYSKRYGMYGTYVLVHQKMASN